MSKRDRDNVSPIRKFEVCHRCGSKLPPGKALCPSCKAWTVGNPHVSDADTVLMSDAKSSEFDRLLTGPWDKALGGGMVKSHVVMIGAVPGGGKTTMGLQMCDEACEQTGQEAFYLSAEMQTNEIKMYGDRMQLRHQNRIRIASTVGGLDVIRKFEGLLQMYKPCLLVLDSIPGLCDDDQEAAVLLCKLIKEQTVKINCPGFLINHVTKQDNFAGLMKLQHAVDVLLTMYLDEASGLRTIQAEKNRGGPAHIPVTLKMTEKGLVEVEYEDISSNTYDE